MKIENEYDYLIHLIYSFLHNEIPDELPENLSLEKVFEYSKSHEVSALTYKSISKLHNIDNSILADWREQYLHAIKRDTIQSVTRNEIVNALHKNGVRTLEVQGSVIKTYYPAPEFRMMSDIDFIIDFDNLKKAQTVLKSIGYETAFDRSINLEAQKEKMHIELHSDFFDEPNKGGKNRYYDTLNNAFSYCKPSKKDELEFIAPPTILYLYSLMHLLKHYEDCGCGIRRIVDFYYLKKSLKSEIDFDFVNQKIASAHLEKKAKELNELEKYFFENNAPTIDLTDPKKLVYMANNHGTAFQKETNDYEEASRHSKFPKLYLFIKRIFPPKWYVYQSYPYCEEHNYPIVLCWFYRFNKTIIKRIKKVFK